MQRARSSEKLRARFALGRKNRAASHMDSGLQPGVERACAMLAGARRIECR